MPYENIVVSLACKSDEEAVIRESVRVAGFAGARLTALHVNEPAAGKMTMMIDPTRRITEEDIRQRFRDLGLDEAADEIVVEAAQQRAYVAPPWKLIWHVDGRPSELFHLENDPLELHDLAASETAVRDALSEKLERWVDRNLAGERTDPIYATDGAWTCTISK